MSELEPNKPACFGQYGWLDGYTLEERSTAARFMAKFGISDALVAGPCHSCHAADACRNVVVEREPEFSVVVRARERYGANYIRGHREKGARP